ncbi:MAG TPA: hypothetical protein VFW07_24675 [Parafilimonas sp.]|nr:hypothetical protein [Parafilimonas sp.]
MKLPRYEFVTEGEAELFTFTSEGPKGNIKKLVVYSQMLQNDIYNLAFGDYNDETDSINDTIITGNNDSQKVLTTVALTLYVFTDKHPNVWVYVTGSNAARTRLYRMGITTNLEEISEDFEVYGLSGDTWQAFEKAKEYEAFLVKRKS